MNAIQVAFFGREVMAGDSQRGTICVHIYFGKQKVCVGGVMGGGRNIYSSCQGLLLGCMFLLVRSPESCVTVLVDIQMQTLKHSASRKKGNN